MSELNFKLVKRHKGEPSFEGELIDYCTMDDGQHALDAIAESTHGERHANSVHYVGRDGEVWIAEVKRVYAD